MSNSKFNAGVEVAYEDLPVRVNYLRWKSGNAQMEALKDTDPSLFFGGWSATVNGVEEKLPELPLPIVKRKSKDGKATYERYATNVLYFLPIANRMRYELREKFINPKTNKEDKRVIAVSKHYESGVHKGYNPMKQVFGLVFNANDPEIYNPAVIRLDSWYAYLSFNKAEQAWTKISVDDEHALIRGYGSVGKEDKNGNVFPVLDSYGESLTTPIEAIGLKEPKQMWITPELDELWNGSQAWANCKRWNAQGIMPKVSDDVLPPMPEPSEDFPFGDPNLD